MFEEAYVELQQWALEKSPYIGHAVLLRDRAQIRHNIWLQEVISELDRIKLFTEREKLLAILRAKTNNETIELEVVINEALNPPKERPLSKKERWQKLASQHPALQKLQDDFGITLLD